MIVFFSSFSAFCLTVRIIKLYQQVFLQLFRWKSIWYGGQENCLTAWKPTNIFSLLSLHSVCRSMLKIPMRTKAKNQCYKSTHSVYLTPCIGKTLKIAAKCRKRLTFDIVLNTRKRFFTAFFPLLCNNAINVLWFGALWEIGKEKSHKKRPFRPKKNLRNECSS